MITYELQLQAHYSITRFAVMCHIYVTIVPIYVKLCHSRCLHDDRFDCLRKRHNKCTLNLIFYQLETPLYYITSTIPCTNIWIRRWSCLELRISKNTAVARYEKLHLSYPRIWNRRWWFSKWPNQDLHFYIYKKNDIRMKYGGRRRENHFVTIILVNIILSPVIPAAYHCWYIHHNYSI